MLAEPVNDAAVRLMSRRLLEATCGRIGHGMGRTSRGDSCRPGWWDRSGSSWLQHWQPGTWSPPPSKQQPMACHAITSARRQAHRSASARARSGEHTSDLQSPMDISYTVIVLERKQRYAMTCIVHRAPTKTL